MGMDVSGHKPVSEAGKYFHNNIWWWHPLAIYVQRVAPEIASRCSTWHTNDGDGLNAKNSKDLATILQAEIDSGRTAQYETALKEFLEAMPDEDCPFCKGIFIWNPVPESSASDPNNGRMRCQNCNGTGKCPPLKAYRFKTENVQGFVNFLRDSGGFSIR